MNYKGTIIHIGETETIGAKGFTKKILVAEDQSQTYKQKICFEFHKDKCAMLDSFAINDLVEIELGKNILNYISVYIRQPKIPASKSEG